MTPFRCGLMCLLLPAAALWPAPAPGQEPVPLPAPCRPLPGLACWAVPSDTGHYVGYAVGGGCLRHGEAPRPEQGTWGWDYAGWLFRPCIKLLWCHRCSRADVSAYRTVGCQKNRSPSSP